VPRSRQHGRDVHRVQELNVSKREIHLVEVKLNTAKIHGLDTNKRPLENNTKFFESQENYPSYFFPWCGRLYL